MGWIWILAFLTLISVLGYKRASLNVWTLSVVLFLVFFARLGGFSPLWIMTTVVLFIILFAPLQFSFLRHKWIIEPLLNKYRKELPPMSNTEREALAAGTVSWEGDLFQGNPDWEKLLAYPPPHFTAEEKAFIEGPLEQLCAMINDWDITHTRADLPPELWKFLKEEGFFALIIPKEYGGKAFSAYAHSQILVKIYGCSTTVGSTVSVPNSLGPAELLLHYGTPEQKNYYLPRLAKGEEIPCFALTGPEAGSDASAMTDTGVVCYGEWNNEKIVGLRLNFNKRYITLAPIATVIGLAFKMYDPDHLLGSKRNIGITCALIPRNTPGIEMGKRHFPANVTFQNGPIQGKDVFIPLDWIIGGPQMAGQGWRMLMECLASGRAISLPASSIGGAKALLSATGAYARVRRQFNVPIGRFEGIQEVLGRMGGFTYIMDATRTFTANLIDQGAKPAVASAITKYHVTELGRQFAADAMDIHGGKGICLGPKNYTMRFYESVPIAITVEGANILTRCLIIFGQGVMRCHPYIFAEAEAARNKNEKDALRDFDTAVMGHMGFTFSNVIRTFILSLTGGRTVKAPSGKLKRYFQEATRFSSAFALLADFSLLIFGGSLKRRENISARLGDVLSELYLLSAVLKQYYDQGKNEEDLPVVKWAALTSLFQIQQKIDEILHNFPNRIIRLFLSFVIFPWGQHFSKPSDKLTRKIANLLLSQTPTRARLTEGAFLSNVSGNTLHLLEDALLKSIAAEPLLKIIKATAHENDTISEQAKRAFAEKIISEEQLNIVLSAEEARQKVIAVDDFTSEELTRIHLKNNTYERYASAHPTD